MQKKRFTEERVSGILRQAERVWQTSGFICRAHGVSEHSFYRWRQKYGGQRLGQAKPDHCYICAVSTKK